MATDPYGTLAKYQDAEAARVAMEQIPYTETEHNVNPFRGNDQTAQALFIKNAPPGLVEFCKNEAKPVDVALFGKSKNLTIESRLAKDPAMFALLQVAQQVRETWVREDVAAAQARRASAEDEIKRLSEVAP